VARQPIVIGDVVVLGEEDPPDHQHAGDVVHGRLPVGDMVKDGEVEDNVERLVRVPDVRDIA